jgi:bifunctional non-homologous end joining protein LigD
MYASIGTAVPTDGDWLFEQKYDGMRVIAEVSPKAVRLITRNGRDKSKQFPEVVSALRDLARTVRRPLVLDGEVVAMSRGKPATFQALQSRMHLKDGDAVAEKAKSEPASLVLFDILRDGRSELYRKPLSDRRERLLKVIAGLGSPRLSASIASPNGAKLIKRARREGWEGVIAKQLDSRYVPGARARSWIKLKLQHRAEFVVGGYTEPRRSREHIGALLLGYFDRAGELRYVGHMGGGFNRDSLRDMLKRLAPLERATSSFADQVRTNEPAHWVTPRVVVEVKFAEWTEDGKLRQPVFLGVRDDKAARDVHKEAESVQQWAQDIGGGGKSAVAASRKRSTARSSRRAATTRRVRVRGAATTIVDQLDEIAGSGGDGELDFGRGRSLHVSSLDKPYFPDDDITKGDVMRYYATVAGMLLPIVDDRPLVLKRYPDGIDGPTFFQQNAGDKTPRGVRTAQVTTEGGVRARRIVGGDLLTLLYTVQIGAIEVHAWQTQLATRKYADTTTIDLDPGDDVPFSAVVSLAKNIKTLLDKAGLRGAIKTSGSSGLHIVLPLPPKTAFEDAARVAEVIAERVVEAQPKRATLERSLEARPAGTIYVDAQQNAPGKSVVAAYSVRARAKATVSAPLDWRELRGTLRLEAFTVRTMPKRLATVGDLWGAAMKRRNTNRAVDRVLGDA